MTLKWQGKGRAVQASKFPDLSSEDVSKVLRMQRDRGFNMAVNVVEVGSAFGSLLPLAHRDA